MTDVTRFLSQIGEGGEKAAQQLLPLVYDEQRKLAAGPSWSRGTAPADSDRGWLDQIAGNGKESSNCGDGDHRDCGV